MAESINVPGVGSVPRRQAAIGLAVVGGLIVVYYVRKGRTAPAAAPTQASQYPPDGTTGNPSDPYSTDPASGQTYGNEAAGAGTYGAFGTAGSLPGSSSGIIGYDGAGNPVYAPGYNPQPAGATAGPPFSTNSAWTQYAIQTLTAGNPSLDPAALTDALGLYTNGQPVDTSQQQMIFDAIAVAGDPPVAGPNGYPPKVQLNGNKGGTPPPPPPPATVPGQVPSELPAITPVVTVPNVRGDYVEAVAVPAIKAAGLVAHLSEPINPVHRYKVVSQTPAPGTRVAKGSTVDLGITISY